MRPPDPSAYLFDLDGTLYQHDAAIPGAVAAIAGLRRRGIPFRCVTNTTSRSRVMLVERLAGYGFDIEAPEIFTATLAAAALARSRGHRTIAPFIPEAALADLTGFTLAGGTAPRSPAVPDAVLIGDLGAGWNYQVMQEAFGYLLAGADLIAGSADRYWQRNGQPVLDCGPFVAALEYASGRRATVAGKPSDAFYRSAVAGLGVDPSAVVMVGDDLWSDVGGAQQAGLQGWLVRTGKFRPGTFDDRAVIPDRVIASVAELTA